MFSRFKRILSIGLKAGTPILLGGAVYHFYTKSHQLIPGQEDSADNGDMFSILKSASKSCPLI